MFELSIHAPKAASVSEEGLQNLRQLVQSYIDDGKVFGTTMVVARHGKVVLHESFGTADGARSSQNNDLYLSMSMGKSFTSAMALRAIEAGRFGLDTKVNQVLPEFKGGGKQLVSVFNLLSHTSGVYCGKIMPPAPYTPADFVDNDKMFQAMCMQAVEFAPSERCAYTPFANHAVLSKLIERTDPHQRSFTQIMHNEVFAPLGMADTTFGNTLDNPRRVSVSYTPKMTTPTSEKTAAFLNQLAQPNALLAGGGNYLTAADTYRFAETLRCGGTNGSYRLLSPAMVDYALQNHTGTMSNDAFVGAWLDLGLPPLRANFHLIGGYTRDSGNFYSMHGKTASSKAFGAMGGGSTGFMCDPERGLTVVFLSAGFVDGLAHLFRLSQINDAAIAACL